MSSSHNSTINSQNFLPFQTKTGAWRRIQGLEAENRQVLAAMHALARQFKAAVSPPREIYLSIQSVKSGTVYIRWRKRGLHGDQKYLQFKSAEGMALLLRQSLEIRRLYLTFNQDALALNLAYCLRLQEIKRVQRYLTDLENVPA